MTRKGHRVVIIGSIEVTVSKFKVTTSVTNNKEADATKRTTKTSKTTKFVSTKKSVLAMTVQYDDKAADTSNQQTAQLYVKYSPTKVGYKGMKWKAKNSKIIYVSPYGVVTPVKAGSTKIYGYTKDGTNKKVTINVKINDKPSNLATPIPHYENETREKVVVEDFESYDIGYNWESDDMEGTAGKATKGKEYVNGNCGKMTVVQDPEDSNNKCLKIEYNGDTQAYDYAPIFNLKGSKLKNKALEKYSAIQVQSRVVSNAPDCKYKAVAAYFDQYKKITPEYYFDTSLTEDDATAKGIDKKFVKFGVSIPMAKGNDEKFNVKDGKFAGMTYNNKTFPMFYDDWAKEKTDENRTVGYKESDAGEAGWHQNTLDFNTGNINNADKTLLTQGQVSVVLGSTYSGKYTGGQYLTLYLDNLALLEGEIACEKINITPATTKVAAGLSTYIDSDYDIAYEPEKTTQKELVWSSSDESIAKVSTTSGHPTIYGIKPGKATITAVCKKNPSIKWSQVYEVFESTLATEDYVVDLSKRVAVKGDNDTTTKVYSNVESTMVDGKLVIPFTKKDSQHVVIDLGEGGVDLTKYQSVEITAYATEQLTFDMYPDGVDFTQDGYYKKQIEWTTYPFFTGSRAIRAQEGGGYDDLAVETFHSNWIEGTAAPHGDLTKVRYLLIKANQYNDNITDRKYEIESIKFCKDKWDKTVLPTEKELNDAGHKKN